MTTTEIKQHIEAEIRRLTRALGELNGIPQAGIHTRPGGKRRARTPEQKAAQSEKMRKYWQSRHATERKSKR